MNRSLYSILFFLSFLNYTNHSSYAGEEFSVRPRLICSTQNLYDLSRIDEKKMNRPFEIYENEQSAQILFYNDHPDNYQLETDSKMLSCKFKQAYYQSEYDSIIINCEFFKRNSFENSITTYSTVSSDLSDCLYY